MDIWIREFSELIRQLLGDPNSGIEYAVLAVVVTASLILTMYLAGSAMRIPNLGIVRRILALVIGIGFLMTVRVGVQKFLLPFVEAEWLRPAVMIGVPLIAGAAVVIPIQQAIFRSSYVATLITFAASIVLAGLLVVLTNAVLGAVLGGEKESAAIKNRRDAINQVIEQ